MNTHTLLHQTANCNWLTAREVPRRGTETAELFLCPLSHGI